MIVVETKKVGTKSTTTYETTNRKNELMEMVNHILKTIPTNKKIIVSVSQ